MFYLRFVLSLILLWSSQAFAQPKHSFKDFIEIEQGRSLYVEYTAPAKGMPTLIVLNGLTYSARNNHRYVEPLIEQGVGILLYDPMGMGKTLLRYAPVTENIPFENQVYDLALLLDTLGFKGRQNFAGLSYGGGLAIAYAAAYPERVEKVIAMAPFTESLEGQNSIIEAQIAASRWFWPFNQMSDEELYEYFFRQLVYTTYPISEPSVLENPYKLDAVMRMALGARPFKASEVAHLIPDGSLHLVVARQDQYIPTIVLDEFWDAIPESKKASRLYLTGTEHKIVEFVANFSAAWTFKILMGEEILFQNRDFEGFPFLRRVLLDGTTYYPNMGL